MLKRKEKGIAKNKNNLLKSNSQTFVLSRKIWSMSWVCPSNWLRRRLWNLWISLASMAGLARSLLIAEILRLAPLPILPRLLPLILAFILLFRGMFSSTSSHSEPTRHGSEATNKHQPNIQQNTKSKTNDLSRDDQSAKPIAYQIYGKLSMTNYSCYMNKN